MAERGTCFISLLILLLLCFSASNLNAIPVTRIPISDHPQHNFRGVHRISQDIETGSVKIRGRMDVELNDYPGSGANNRHSPNPKPQIIGRACNLDDC